MTAPVRPFRAPGQHPFLRALLFLALLIEAVWLAFLGLDALNDLLARGLASLPGVGR